MTLPLIKTLITPMHTIYQGYIFYKLLRWWGEWLLGKKMKTEGVGKKLKRREKGKGKKVKRA